MLFKENLLSFQNNTIERINSTKINENYLVENIICGVGDEENCMFS